MLWKPYHGHVCGCCGICHSMSQYALFVDDVDTVTVVSICTYHITLRITLSMTTDNTVVCTPSIWWWGERGFRSWSFCTKIDEGSSRNIDRNVSSRCYRQKHWTTHPKVLKEHWTNHPKGFLRRLYGFLNTWSLVSCPQSLLPKTVGLSRGGFTLNGSL